MSHLTPGVVDVMQCTGADGGSCQDRGAGHALHALQERVTAATPSKWRDGFISHVSAGGWIGVDLLETGETAWLWNHADLTASVTLGQPVAVHALYHALAVGRDRINVLVASLD
ncbi:hypothetical protein [Cryobacterium tagatosivorans]|uniref:Uncharacterized protein n=1 Tax=Cryobacterium tagatosivorans TaxID=1259199 RepID=A0A4V3I6S5_9MICO|nr:hypothetical protein [Cryobacterium tagatosivorans]TFB54767.1 hypothetical protein E3O23_03210 [Cryobacterium tagatosivorans]